MDLECYQTPFLPSVQKLLVKLREFRGYIEANKAFIPNYGDHYRYGEVVSTAFIESTVNQVVSKRMVKKQETRSVADILRCRLTDPLLSLSISPHFGSAIRLLETDLWVGG